MSFYFSHAPQREDYQDSSILKNPPQEVHFNDQSFTNSANYQYAQSMPVGYYGNPQYQVYPAMQSQEPQPVVNHNEMSLLEMYKNSLSYMVQELATTWTNSPGDPIFLHHLFRIQMSQSLSDLHPYISLFGPCFESLSSSSWLISLSQYLIIKLNSLYLYDTNDRSNGGETIPNVNYFEENRYLNHNITPPPRYNSSDRHLTPPAQYADVDINSKSSTRSSARSMGSSFQNHPLYQSYDNSYTSSHLSENTEYYTDSSHTPNPANYKEMLWKFPKSNSYPPPNTYTPDRHCPEKPYLSGGNKYLINTPNKPLANYPSFENQTSKPQDQSNEYMNNPQKSYDIPDKQHVSNQSYTSPKTRTRSANRTAQNIRTASKSSLKSNTDNGEIVMLSDYAQPMKGVSFNAKKQAWLAYWTMMNNFQMRKFPIKKHGFKNAKQLAIQCRLEAERQNSNERLERAKEKMALQGNGL